MSSINSKQVWDDNKGASLNQILAALTLSSGPGTITFPDGTIVKWGSTGAFGAISANTSANLAFNFPAEFPTQCDFFFALLTPAASTDFYGVTSLVSKSKTGVQFIARNGATAQSISGGVFVAIGK